MWDLGTCARCVAVAWRCRSRAVFDRLQLGGDALRNKGVGVLHDASVGACGVAGLGLLRLGGDL